MSNAIEINWKINYYWITCGIQLIDAGYLSDWNVKLNYYLAAMSSLFLLLLAHPNEVLMTREAQTIKIVTLLLTYFFDSKCVASTGAVENWSSCCTIANEIERQCKQKLNESNRLLQTFFIQPLDLRDTCKWILIDKLTFSHENLQGIAHRRKDSTIVYVWRKIKEE